MKKTINILGTKYKIKQHYSKNNKRLSNCDGYVDFSIKEIVIEKFTDEQSKDPELQKDLGKYGNTVLRHEIAHAYLYESGLIDYASDERLVDWIAVQLPKIAKTIKELEL